VSVLQGVDSNYKTDLFTPILDRIQQLAGHTPKQRLDLLTPYRVIADHVRAATFLIADGVVPGNVGRNYVCRMIVRRASRFGSKAGFDDPFLGQIAEAVIEEYGDVYPEIVRNRPAVMRTLVDEERRFRRTVETGVGHLDELIHSSTARGEYVLPGSSAFDLYATYGLPLEITRDIARESGLEVEEAGFREAMETHRDVSSAGAEWGADAGEVPLEIYQQALADLQAASALPAQGVQVDPYGGFEIEVPLLAIIGPGGNQSLASPGEAVGLVLAAHTFYTEAGGQVSDMGTVASVKEPRWEFQVQAALRPIAGLSVLQGTVLRGQPHSGDLAIAAVDRDRRWDVMRNHTATHLLHGALRAVLGEHALQAGSMVAPDRLRFDFTHPQAMTAEELDRVETLVQQAVLSNLDVVSRLKPRQEAIGEGAMALFGETYGETVRTVAIGDTPRVSYELCGGTHVPETGIIGTFLILSEGSVAAGIRRIEAVTGRAALELVKARMGALERLARQLGTSPETVEARVHALLEEQSALERRLETLRLQQAEAEALQLRPQQVQGVTMIAGEVGSADAETLRRLVDRLRARYPSSVIVLGSAPEGRPVIVAAISPDGVARGLHAGELVKQAAGVMGGGGGGKPGMAQAGGKDPSKLRLALDQAEDYVRRHLA
ncbi:MAG: alanine--tRNA ligase, partial [Anaerolineales bacterium]|nr:alanine--tRNA ligase [Anaerolineales bacterium]